MFSAKSTFNEAGSNAKPAAASGKEVSIQRQLTVGKEDDPMEKEADVVADKVMRMPEQNFVQRKCAECEKQEMLHRKPLNETITPFIQTKSDSTPIVTNHTAQSIESSKGQGSPMDRHTNSYMSSRFGTDFSHVKIHRDSEAIQLNRDLKAKAFTTGNDIYFNEGQYEPGADSGKHLLAHELTHVVQQEKLSSSLVQRVTAIDNTGQVHETNDLNDKLLGNRIYGLTVSVLNTVKIINGNGQQDAQNAIKKPFLTSSGSAAAGFDVKVTNVPTNSFSFDETVLKAGPWSTKNVAKNVVGRLFSDHRKYPDAARCNDASITHVHAQGDSTDADMFDANRRHEDHHVADHKAEFSNIIVPWDNKLEAAKNAGTVFHAATQATAEANLYAAMDGTPDQIAVKFAQALVIANNTFHGTADGGVIEWKSLVVDGDCSNVIANGHNPG